ncbi:hypothetical protein BLOT_001133 [Blomia tropicalis]|nr:hypothetical protein BLOT_001133 [Blomia tropicalis]
MTLQQSAIAQSNSLLGQRFEETRREVVRLRRTNEYLRETLSTHENLIRLLEGIRECLERRNDDLMEVCACKNFLRPDNLHIADDDLNELYTQYYQAKSTHGLPMY